MWKDSITTLNRIIAIISSVYQMQLMLNFVLFLWNISNNVLALNRSDRNGLNIHRNWFFGIYVKMTFILFMLFYQYLDIFIVLDQLFCDIPTTADDVLRVIVSFPTTRRHVGVQACRCGVCHASCRHYADRFTWGTTNPFWSMRWIKV